MIFYEGLLRAYFIRNPEDAPAIFKEKHFLGQDGKQFSSWLVSYLMNLKPEIEILSLCLKINLLNVFDNLVMLKKLLVLYRKSSRGSLKTRLQYFHIQELYKAKIDAFYNYKIDLGDNKQEASLNSQYYILLQ